MGPTEKQVKEEEHMQLQSKRKKQQENCKPFQKLQYFSQCYSNRKKVLRTCSRPYRPIKHIYFNISSSCSQMFFKICFLKNFAAFTGKDLCWNLSLVTLHVFRPVTLLKRDSNTNVLLRILQNFVRPAFSYNTSCGCFFNINSKLKN